jgi:antiphage defense system Thoeris ThsB-like protein
MGGSYERGVQLSSDLDKLEEIAKDALSDNDSSRHVFLSFNHKDINDVNMLRGQAKNPNNDLKFDDHSVKEPFNSRNAEYIKQKIREKIRRCSVTIVYLSSNSTHSDWVNWEIKESMRLGKGVIGVYTGTRPVKLPKEFTDNNCKAVKWSHLNLKHEIEKASENR